MGLSDFVQMEILYCSFLQNLAESGNLELASYLTWNGRKGPVKSSRVSLWKVEETSILHRGYLSSSASRPAVEKSYGQATPRDLASVAVRGRVI